MLSFEEMIDGIFRRKNTTEKRHAANLHVDANEAHITLAGGHKSAADRANAMRRIHICL